VGLLQCLAGHTPAGLDAVCGEVTFLFTVRAEARRVSPLDGGKGGGICIGLCSVSPVDRIFLLKAAQDQVGPKGGRVHGSIKGGLKMFVLIAEGIEEKDYFDLVEIDRSHVRDPCVHGENLVGAVAEWSIATIVEIKRLLEKKKLSMCAEFLVALLELLEHEVQSRMMRNSIVVHFGNAPTDKTTKGAVIRLPDVVCLGVEGGGWLGESPFQPSGESETITLHFELEAPLLPI